MTENEAIRKLAETLPTKPGVSLDWISGASFAVIHDRAIPVDLVPAFAACGAEKYSTFRAGYFDDGVSTVVLLLGGEKPYPERVISIERVKGG